jgi:hypothetical protein
VKAGEPVADILKHLHRAGIIVLLAVDTDVTDTSSLRLDESYYADLKKKTDLSVESVAGYIKEISTYSSGISEHGDYI